ncbi:clostripain-related cysteine peptidase [Ruminococcus sp. HUN007]|uniref:clostripain-related cysteine peptidase n=1 Tax=Ruminococcus sp. HUN007 TaxID=1514668 RepID=UPI0005D20E12|nr:clostripain-related cysteine peptidase [Ruminococcus sp. HUN007]
MDNRPRSREKNVTSGGSGAHRRGEGLGTGPVGSSGSFSSHSSGSSTSRKVITRGGIGLPVLLIAGYFLLKFLGGSGGGIDVSDLMGGNNGIMDSFVSSGSSSGSVGYSADYSAVDTSVAAGSREKRTNILGNGADQVTLMVYMCGTDLESKYGMATNDLQEMASAKFGDNVNVIVYTGGCRGWKTNGISSSSNQIYKVESGGIRCLEKNMGTGAMTDPETLTSFIKYCAQNYPANRNDLILWDHGGGSVSGYGYDEINRNKGSMDLSKLDSALKNGGVTFDFIGFDACLMATAETAFMAEKYADYLIASEETEPGIGWYYKNWLTNLGDNPSMSTLDIGKNIVDDFVSTCASQCRGQKTTLSVIDLAEFINTVPSKMSGFAQSVSTELKNKNYKQISDARYNTREFAQSSRIDQVDLVHLANNIGTPEAKELASVLKSAVKYNQTSKEMTEAYGVSIYFPYKAASKVDSACSTMNKIGMDNDYASCIRQFASLETSGQIAAGGSAAGSPVSSLLDSFMPSGSDIASQLMSGGSGSLVNSLLGSLTGGSVAGLDLSNIDFMKEMPMSDEDTTNYLAANMIDTNNLIWKNSGDKYTISMSESQWALVHELDKNMFYDDGSGYIDLGTDNVFDFTDAGDLVADTDKTWVSINGQPVAYYHTDTTDDGKNFTVSGYVPAFLNGERVNLILVFEDGKNGFIAGASTDYIDGETDAVAKNLTELKAGDELDFVCDYYTYDGKYVDSFYFGEKMTVTSDMKVSDTVVGDGAVKVLYRFTDIYNQEYWTEAIDVK